MAFCVEDEWEGWAGETVVKLNNGTYWKQAEYLYEYHYAYRPAVRMEGNLMHVHGMSRGVRVQQIYPTETRVAGAWKGWDGKTQVQLQNGQVWEQAVYHYEYKYAYQPEVMIDGNEMYVQGMSKLTGLGLEGSVG